MDLPKWNHLYSVFCGMALMGIIWFAMSADSSRLLKVSIGEATLEMQADNMEIQHEELLDLTYEDRFARGGLMAWLVSKQIFEAADPELVEAIATKVCEPVPEDDDWEERLRLGRDCASRPVVAELRRRADRRRTPFHYIGDIVTIGVPDNRPPQGRAYACRDGVFWRRTVRLTNLNDNQRSVSVEVTGHYPCTDPTAPQIQLSEEDAISLFGGPTRKIERAEAIVVD